LKIHISVKVKSKKILAMKVTDVEHVHDSKALPELVEENIIKSNSTTTTAIMVVGKLFADDGTYDGNNILGI
jgi:hypothetical protein